MREIWGKAKENKNWLIGIALGILIARWDLEMIIPIILLSIFIFATIFER